MIKRVNISTLKELYKKHGLRWARRALRSEDCCCVLGILLEEEGLPRISTILAIIELSLRVGVLII